MFKRTLLVITTAWACYTCQAWQTTDTVSVHFRKGLSTMDTTYMDNARAARRIRSILSDTTLTSINVRGAASPEGAPTLNQRLSRQRAQGVASYFGLPQNIITTTFTGSDWQRLLEQVRKDPAVPFREEVEQVLADIIATPANACAIDVLRNMHSGRPYSYLYREHFPSLRTAEIVFTLTPASVRETYAATVATADTTAYEDTVFKEVELCPIPPVTNGYIMGVKTNMLYDVALIPNVGIEFPMGRHMSIGANWMYAWWKNRRRNRHWRIYGGDVNLRYWPGAHGATLTGHHVGLYGTVLLYQVAFGGKGYISGIPGDNMAGGKRWWGAGVEYGYSLQLNRRLNIDFTLGVGYTSGEQRDYRMIDGCYVWQSSARKHWIGPTKAEISLVWKIGRLAKK